MPSVDSSAISRVEYDPAEQKLIVTFRPSGETYAYLQVPQQTYDDLLSADSIGRFFNEHVRDSYEHARYSGQRRLTRARGWAER